MKTLKIILLLLAVSVSFSCENNSISGFAIRNLSYGDCKSSLKNNTNDEYIECKTKDNNQLEIRHINAIFNCCPESIIAEGTLINDTVSINEVDILPACDCICPYDLNYTIGVMDYGYYEIVLNYDGLLRHQFSINFNQNTDTIIYLN